MWHCGCGATWTWREIHCACCGYLRPSVLGQTWQCGHCLVWNIPQRTVCHVCAKDRREATPATPLHLFPPEARLALAYLRHRYLRGEFGEDKANG